MEFALDAAGRQALGNFKLAAYFELVHPTYRHKSPLLGEDVRQSLLDDLTLSDKDHEKIANR